MSAPSPISSQREYDLKDVLSLKLLNMLISSEVPMCEMLAVFVLLTFLLTVDVVVDVLQALDHKLRAKVHNVEVIAFWRRLDDFVYLLFEVCLSYLTDI